MHDNGPVFTGHDFQVALHADIKSVNISPYTLSANDTIESSHKRISQFLRALKHPASPVAAETLAEEALVTAMLVLNSIPNQSRGIHSPGSFVSNRGKFSEFLSRSSASSS